MTQTPFDQFSKQHLKGLLSPLGTVNISREVPGEALSIDLWFEPAAQTDIDRASRGLLGQIAATPCLLEPFRNSPAAAEIRSCLQKLYWIHGEYQRQAERDERHLPEANLPRLWILAPSLSKARARDLGVNPDPDHWEAGIYLWGPVLKAAIVAISQLPATRDTLWLRLMGKGKTQKRAIEETLALPADEAFRADAVRLLESWKITIEKSGIQSPEDAETMSTFTEVYQELLERDQKHEAAQRKILELQQELQQLRQLALEKSSSQDREDAETMPTFTEVYQELLERDRRREEEAEAAQRKILELQQELQQLRQLALGKSETQNQEDAATMPTLPAVPQARVEPDRKQEAADEEAQAQRKILELQQEKQALQQEKEIARQQERCVTIENLLKMRFGVLDEALAAIVQPLSELPAEDYAQFLLQVSNLSREDLLAQFGQD